MEIKLLSVLYQNQLSIIEGLRWPVWTHQSIQRESRPCHWSGKVASTVKKINRWKSYMFDINLQIIFDLRSLAIWYRTLRSHCRMPVPSEKLLNEYFFLHRRDQTGRDYTYRSWIVHDKNKIWKKTYTLEKSIHPFGDIRSWLTEWNRSAVFVQKWCVFYLPG